MTDDELQRIARAAAAKFLAGDFNQAEFELACKKAWEEVNGPVPQGREFVVGILQTRLAMGHIDASASDADKQQAMLNLFVQDIAARDCGVSVKVEDNG